MQTKQTVIQLSEETFARLEKRATSRNCTPEELAAKLLEEALAATEPNAKTAAYPGVALLKNGYSPLLSDNTASETEDKKTDTNNAAKPVLAAATANTNWQINIPAHNNMPSPEAMQRRHKIEGEMRELSLLIETAEPQKKENYLLQYALLAAELDSII